MFVQYFNKSILSRMFSNLFYRSNITTHNDEDFNKVLNAALNGENELLQVV